MVITIIVDDQLQLFSGYIIITYIRNEYVQVPCEEIIHRFYMIFIGMS